MHTARFPGKRAVASRASFPDLAWTSAQFETPRHAISYINTPDNLCALSKAFYSSSTLGLSRALNSVDVDAFVSKRLEERDGCEGLEAFPW
jgi:hypothetical protein